MMAPVLIRGGINMAVDKKKLRVINKLFEQGHETEKEINALTARDMVSIPDIAVADMAEILKLQDAIKAGKVISYLSGKLNEPTKREDEKHDV